MRPGRAAAGPPALALALAIGWSAPALADSAASRNNEGNRLYAQQQYDAALRMYMDAQASRPEAPELHYNIGNALYRKGEHEKAAEEYRRAESARDRSLAQAAAFNRGNALMMLGRVDEAVTAYGAVIERH
ncbi:MAG: tetratricopeptide repeat protein, partial [Acidobacteriota bacterium]